MTAKRRSSALWCQVLLGFGKIGLTAFGGGSATLIAMRRLCVNDKAWMTEEEYVDCFVLSRLSPGINILAQVILIGRRVSGWAGALGAVIGLMFPAVVITVILCRGYILVRSTPWSTGPLAGLSAAVAGFTIALTVDLARGAVRRETILIDILLLAAYGAVALSGVNPVLVILGSLAVGVGVPNLLVRRDTTDQDDEP